MQVDKSANAAEIIGVIAVVLSLVFVGFELRHANRLAEAEAIQTINEMIAEKLNSTTSSQWAMERIAAASDQTVDEMGFRYERISWMNIYEAAWTSFDNGIIDRAQLDA